MLSTTSFAAWLVFAGALASDSPPPVARDISGRLGAAPIEEAPPSTASAAVRGVLAPLRGAAYVYDRYQLPARWREIFYNQAGTFAVYPTALFETGFGPNVGARLRHTDLFDRHESLQLAAGYGGELRQHYRAEVTTGERLGQVVRLGARASWERRPSTRFFGLGDAPLVTGVPDRVDARAAADRIAIDSRLRQSVARGDLEARLKLRRGLSFTVTQRWTRRHLDELDGTFYPQSGRTFDRFAPGSLTGAVPEVTASYSEMALQLDTLENPDLLSPRSAPSRGWRGRAYAGWYTALGRPWTTARYGADVRRLIPLWREDRVLVVRGYLDALTAARDDVPFLELPRLGGPGLLRGHMHDRFRDRAAAMVSVEYRYPIWDQLGGYLFVDAGRVAREVRALPAWRPRLSAGGGFEIRSWRQSWMSLQIAASSEGAFLQLRLDPMLAPVDPAGRV